MLHTVVQNTYINSAGIVGLEPNDGQSTLLILDAILRPKPRNNLDGVRHDRQMVVIPERS
jgi:hypothetical protein